MPRPTFRDAYLVEDSMGGPCVGVVRRERAVWTILRLGVPTEQQPREAFASREEAGTRLLEYSTSEQGLQSRSVSVEGSHPAE